MNGPLDASLADAVPTGVVGEICASTQAAESRLSLKVALSTDSTLMNTKSMSDRCASQTTAR